ncbi:MAG: cupin domain-containing protein [Alphaproteobacteria bacterium]
MYKYLITLAALCFTFDASAATSEILKKSQNSWNDTPIKQMNLTEPEVTVVRIQIPKGEKLPLHQHPILNVGYLTKGELTVHTQKDEVLVLKAGDPIIEVIDTWHYGESTGDEDAEIVVVYVGNKGDTFTETKE